MALVALEKVNQGFKYQCINSNNCWNHWNCLIFNKTIKLKEPLIDLRVFKYPMYTHAILMFLIIIMTMFASEIILPIYARTIGFNCSYCGVNFTAGQFT